MTRKVSTEMDIRLIEGVRTHPALYDRANAQYRDTNFKRLAWETIAEDSGFKDGGVASKRWHNIRDQYTKWMKHHIRRNNDGGSAADENGGGTGAGGAGDSLYAPINENSRLFIYYHELKFLEPHIGFNFFGLWSSSSYHAQASHQNHPPLQQHTPGTGGAAEFSGGHASASSSGDNKTPSEALMQMAAAAASGRPRRNAALQRPSYVDDLFYDDDEDEDDDEEGDEEEVNVGGLGGTPADGYVDNGGNIFSMDGAGTAGGYTVAPAHHPHNQHELSTAAAYQQQHGSAGGKHKPAAYLTAQHQQRHRLLDGTGGGGSGSSAKSHRNFLLGQHHRRQHMVGTGGNQRLLMFPRRGAAVGRSTFGTPGKMAAVAGSSKLAPYNGVNSPDPDQPDTEEDTETLFGRRVARLLKQLPDRRRRLAAIEIEQLLYKAEYDSANDGHPAPGIGNNNNNKSALFAEDGSASSSTSAATAAGGGTGTSVVVSGAGGGGGTVVETRTIVGGDGVNTGGGNNAYAGNACGGGGAEMKNFLMGAPAAGHPVVAPHDDHSQDSNNIGSASVMAGTGIMLCIGGGCSGNGGAFVAGGRLGNTGNTNSNSIDYGQQ